MPDTAATSTALFEPALFDRLRLSLPEIEVEAERCDRDGVFPRRGLALLREAGALAAPLPASLGGLGLGTEPTGALGMLRLLRLVGAANLSLGRLFEGHVNALKLILRYGTRAQGQDAAAAVRDGALFGIWVTEGSDGLRYTQDAPGGFLRLHGAKLFASGAAEVTHPLVTALSPEGDTRMMVVPLRGDRAVEAMLASLSGMRGACTGRHDFSGFVRDPGILLGAPGDYLRQPEFSAGAWRGMAVALGGIDRLVSLFCTALAERGRDANPHQRVRIGEALIARETAALWTRKAALVAEGDRFDPGDVAATVNLARIACETAGLDVIRLVQRGLGLSAFLSGSAVERVMRDLATYLRQPAPDETLVEGAAWFGGRSLPDADAAA